jgi:hypothetical protein
MVSVSDTGIIISNGKGAIINMVGPSTDINAVPNDHLIMPGFVLHLGAAVMCAHADKRKPTARIHGCW